VRPDLSPGAVPKGRPESSPGRQSWVHIELKSIESPRGRLKNVCDQFSRPVRDWTHLLILPRTDVLGYFQAVPSGLGGGVGYVKGTPKRVGIDRKAKNSRCNL
jgi:hypothetical protein